MYLSCDCSSSLEAQSHGKESGIDSLFSPLLLRFTIKYLLTPEMSKLYQIQHLVFLPFVYVDFRASEQSFRIQNLVINIIRKYVLLHTRLTIL